MFTRRVGTLDKPRGSADTPLLAQVRRGLGCGRRGCFATPLVCSQHPQQLLLPTPLLTPLDCQENHIRDIVSLRAGIGRLEVQRLYQGNRILSRSRWRKQHDLRARKCGRRRTGSGGLHTRS